MRRFGNDDSRRVLALEVLCFGGYDFSFRNVRGGETVMTLPPELKKALEAEMYKDPYGEMIIEMNDVVRVVASFLESKRKELEKEMNVDITAEKDYGYVEGIKRALTVFGGEGK